MVSQRAENKNGWTGRRKKFLQKMLKVVSRSAKRRCLSHVPIDDRLFGLSGRNFQIFFSRTLNYSTDLILANSDVVNNVTRFRSLLVLVQPQPFRDTTFDGSLKNYDVIKAADRSL